VFGARRRAVDFPGIEGDCTQETTAPTRKLDPWRRDPRSAGRWWDLAKRIREMDFGFHHWRARNAGKSRLLTDWHGREAAIVTPKAATTRDVIEVRRVLGGHVVGLRTTAGLRVTEDELRPRACAARNWRTGPQTLRRVPD